MVLPAAVVFDLDGTLVDSAPGIATALNAVRRRATPVVADDVRPWVSLGAARMVEATLGLAESEVEATLVAFRERYAENPCTIGDLYPGAADVLATLKHSGMAVAVCTNKPQALADRVVECVDLRGVVDVVVGASSRHPPKPDPAQLVASLDLLGRRKPAVMIGDSSIDALTSQAAGIPFIFAEFGYGPFDPLLPTAATLAGFDDLVRVLSAVTASLE